VPARRMPDFESVLASSDILIVGGPEPIDKTLTALQSGLHVSAYAPMTYSSRSLLRAAHVSKRQKRLLHLFDPMLYRPAFRTIRGHLRPSEVSELSARTSTPEPASTATEILRRNLGLIHRIVVLGGPVDTIEGTSFDGTTFAAHLRFQKGAKASIALSVGPEQSLLEVQSSLSWVLEGPHLYCGSSMTTLTDNRSPEELAVLEIRQIAAGRARQTLTVEAHYHTLSLLEKLATGVPGALR